MHFREYTTNYSEMYDFSLTFYTYFNSKIMNILLSRKV
mgnify:CR=1 FL=1